VNSSIWYEIEDTITLLQYLKEQYHETNPFKDNPAKKLADNFLDYVPMVFGSSLLRGTAYRWCTQFNENAKIPAANGFFPEVFHNFVMSREAEDKLLDQICAVILKDPKDLEDNDRIIKFSDMMREKFGCVKMIEAIGEGRLSRILSTVYLGDYVTTYLGLLYGKDPSAINSILALKI
jgi:glucose/mannose-6-phosphate isomerase